MSNPSDLSTALIAIGSAVAGGVVTGGFTFWALRKEHRHDAQVDRERRSRDAVKRVLESSVGLDKALNTVAMTRSLGGPEVAAANEFAQTMSVASVEIMDGELRRRLKRHMTLCQASLRGIQEHQRIDELAVALIKTARSHALAMHRAIDAHLNGERLPDYMYFDLTNVPAILEWGRNAEQQE